MQGCAYSSPEVRCSSSTHLCSCFAAWLIWRRNFSVSTTLVNLSGCLGFYFCMLEEEGAKPGFSLHRCTVISCPTAELYLLIVMLLVRAACLYQDTVFSACLRLYWQSQALSGGIKISIYQDLTAAIKGNGLGNGAPFTSSSDGTLIESSASWDGVVLLVSYSICHFKGSVKPTYPCLRLLRSILFKCCAWVVLEHSSSFAEKVSKNKS